MTTRLIYPFAFVLIVCSTACEDPIEVPSQFEESQLVVDAWLTNTDSEQTIILNETVDYFAGGNPAPVTEATVQVCNERTLSCVFFAHQGEGRYTWQPDPGQQLGQVGDVLALGIQLGERQVVSTTDISRTVRIDSIGLETEEEGTLGLADGIYAQLYAFDSLGQGDTYWVRAYKNDTLLNRPTEQIVAYDATFDAGTSIDGTYFITPLRIGINPLDDDGFFVPYEPGDNIYVEVHSINEFAFQFINIAVEQILNEGIFASPLANAPSNIVDADTGDRVLGIFNVAEVASIAVEVEE